MSSDDKVEGAIMGLLVVLLAAPLAMVFRGLIFSVMWRWFIMPVFHVGTISIAEAIGLSIVVGFFTPWPETKKADGSRSVLSMVSAILAKMFLAPLFSLFMAWIVQMFT